MGILVAVIVMEENTYNTVSNTISTYSYEHTQLP